MRVRVIGDNNAARALRSSLTRAGIVVSDTFPWLSVTIEDGPAPDIVVDGVDSDLERYVVNHICDMAPGVYLARKGGIRSARALRIQVPPVDALLAAVERGCLRGIVEASKPKSRLRAIWDALTR